jgi:hypothetical protein
MLTFQARRPDKDTRRILLEFLDTVREMRPYLPLKSGRAHRIKVLLRKAGVPIPRPRREK